MRSFKFCVLLFAFFVFTIFTLAGCGGKSTRSGSAPVASGGGTPPPSGSSGSAASPTPTPAPANATVANNIEDMPNWQFCTALMNGQTCASGLGNATSSMVENQPSPSIDGSSAKFNLGGRTPYSNALWWRSIGANDNATHFNYDVSFFIDRPDFPEALEFDVNEAIGGVRYIWGSECDFKNSGKWDVWNPAASKWQHTPLQCRQFSANTWHHLTWELERVNHQVHYIALTVDGQRMNVDILMDPQSNYSGDDISVAFQLDGDFRQDAYNVWLDQVTLTMW